MQVPEELIDRLKRKDPAAYEEFLSLYGKQLLSFGFRMCGDTEDAREVLQETLLKTFESIGDLKHSGAFKGWLYRIATNACLMRRRQSKFLKEEITLDEALPGPARADAPWQRLPDEVVLGGEVKGKIREAILNLPDTYRSVLVLRDLEGLDTEEAAAALSLSKDVVKMRLHRARAKIRNDLEGYFQDGGRQVG